MRAPPDELNRITSTIELAEGLALILVVGPDFRAEEGLSLVRSRLPGSLPTLWHRLDRDGPDLVSAVRGSGLQEPILLVHGLEYLEDKDQATTEASLNMLRDQLVALRAAIILWVPQSGMEAFQRHCADLFAWRSLLVSLTEAQVPAEPDTEDRRLYLSQLRADLQGLIDEKFNFRPVRLEALSERRVRPHDSRASIPLYQWVRTTPAGLLLGEAGSGKSAALRALALRYVQESLEGGQDVPCPVLVNVRELYLGPLFGLNLDEHDLPRQEMLGRQVQFSQARADWARSGDLLLLLDGFEDIERDSLPILIKWLEGLRARFPQIRVVASARAELEGFETTQWQVARLAHMPLTDWERHPGLMPSWGHQLHTLQAGLRKLEMLPQLGGIASPLLIRVVYNLMRTVGPDEWSPASLLERSIEVLLQNAEDRYTGWHFRFRPKVLRRFFPLLAFRTLEKPSRTFSRQDYLEVRERNQEPHELRGYFNSMRWDLLSNPSSVSERLPWLFTGTDPDRFRFTYPLFEAFLAAEWIAAQGPGAAAAQLEPHLYQRKWRAVVPLVAALLGKNNPITARLFLEQLWLGPASSSSKHMLLVALVLDSARAARLPRYHTRTWRNRADQLSQIPARSKEETSAQKKLRTALDRLEAQSPGRPETSGR